MRYDDGVEKVPACAIATEDAEALARMLATAPVRVRLQLGCRTEPDVMSHNVIAEIRGSERPDEPRQHTLEHDAAFCADDLVVFCVSKNLVERVAAVWPRANTIYESLPEAFASLVMWGIG